MIVIIGSVVNMRGTFFVFIMILVRHRAAGINVKVFRDVRVIIMIMVCGFVVGMFSSVGMDLIGGVIVGV